MRTIPPHLIQRVEVPTEQISLVGDIPEGWIPTASSWIQAVRYHPASQSFDLMTRQGQVYPDYPDCPPAKFRELLAAPSKGQWMWANYPPRG